MLVYGKTNTILLSKKKKKEKRKKDVIYKKINILLINK